jgi:glutathione S-transferase
VIELIQEVFYKPDPAARDQKRVAAAIERLGVVYRWLERELEGRELLCGAFSVADIGWFLSIGFATSLGAPPDPALGAVGAWLARVAARPSVQREQEGMRAAMLALSDAPGA